jgi:acetyl esterase/lipase
MTFAKFVFLLIDKLFDGQQNPRKMTKQLHEGLTIQKDIVFDERYPKYKLDTYVRPRTDGKPYPVIMEIHGGGFSAGDKKYRRCLSGWFAQNTGAFVVNVNYGLGSKSVAPEPTRHLVAAFNWIIANAEKYNLDTDKIVITGDSAGAYYAAMLSAVQDNEKLQEIYGKMNGRIAAGVYNCGIYDVQIALKQKILFNLTEGVCKDFTGGKVKDLDHYELMPYVAPIDYVTDKWPKSYIVYAAQDFFCGGQGEHIVETLQNLGVYVESYGSTEYSDNHTFSLTWKSQAAQEANAGILSFLNRFFNGEI